MRGGAHIVHIKSFICFFVALISIFQSCSGVIDILKQLNAIVSPSGFEGDMRVFLINRWKKLCKDVKIDHLGNAYFGINCVIGKHDKPVVVISAHMDEVGLIVKSITDDGFIKFEPLGGWLDVAIPLQKWIIKASPKNVVGYSGFESAHVCNTYPSVPLKPLSKMFIDVGATSKKEVEAMGIRPGIGIVPYPCFEIMGPKSQRLLMKALDNKVAFAILDKVISKLKTESLDVDLVVVATVQEEVGMRGAKAIPGTVKPDIFISIDTSMSNDFPLQATEKDESGTKLGGGISFFAFDSSMIPDQKLLEFLIDFSKKHNIRYQFDVMPLYGHDASSLQQTFQGIPTINIGIPCRYTHSSGSIVDLEDIQTSCDFFTILIKEIKVIDIRNIQDKGSQ